MAKGGKRPGAGKPKGSLASHTIKAIEARAYVIKRVTEELEPILTGQIEMAKGIYYEDDGKKIYRKLPDGKAAEYLINQNIGKPKETVDLIEEIILKIDV